MGEVQSVVGLCSSTVIIIPPDQLNQKRKTVAAEVLKALAACHIYLICTRPKLTFDPATFTYNFVGSSGHFVRRIKGVEERVPFSFRPAPEPAGRVEVAPYPHRQLVSVLADGSAGDFAWPASVMAQQTNVPDRAIFDLEVVYVGQAYGQGHRSAMDRLRSHETLQKVLASTAENSPDDEVLIIMVQVEPPQIFTSIDGTRDAQFMGKADTEHWLDIFKHPLTEKQQISLNEAGLIAYFKPHYKDKFKDLFPKYTQLFLKQCYERDFWGLNVEVNTEDLHLRLWSPQRAAGYHHIGSFDLHDPTQRMAFFGVTDASGKFHAVDISGPSY